MMLMLVLANQAEDLMQVEQDQVSEFQVLAELRQRRLKHSSRETHVECECLRNLEVVKDCMGKHEGSDEIQRHCCNILQCCTWDGESNSKPISNALDVGFVT